MAIQEQKKEGATVSVVHETKDALNRFILTGVAPAITNLTQAQKAFFDKINIARIFALEQKTFASFSKLILSMPISTFSVFNFGTPVAKLIAERARKTLLEYQNQDEQAKTE